MQLNECINFMLTNVQNAVFLCFKKQLQQFNVTPIQYALLKCLWDEDEQAPSQLAQHLCLDSSTVTCCTSPNRPTSWPRNNYFSHKQKSRIAK